MTLTTEQVALWKRNAEITAGETAEDDPEHIAAKAILALTAELLANREAQPVAWNFPGSETESRQLGYDDELDSEQKRNCIPLYTAPPPPAVPDEIKRNPESGWHVGPDGKNWSALEAAGWNACRAAMLGGDKPSSPTGWIACADALPQDGENIITLNNVGGVYGGYIFRQYANGSWAFVDAEEEFRGDDSVTHWMPLPEVR